MPRTRTGACGFIYTSIHVHATQVANNDAARATSVTTPIRPRSEVAPLVLLPLILPEPPEPEPPLEELIKIQLFPEGVAILVLVGDVAIVCVGIVVTVISTGVVPPTGLALVGVKLGAAEAAEEIEEISGSQGTVHEWNFLHREEAIEQCGYRVR
ncbi:hypothetical protein BD779DRAFT_1147867 [Infundibulicybe gibba]|nr:hypothetical protein BD779DRAFT_1147867 [Infundibulicybe gibba]